MNINNNQQSKQVVECINLGLIRQLGGIDFGCFGMNFLEFPLGELLGFA